MDIQKEREAFDQYFKEKYQEFHNEVFDENGDDRAIIGYSFAWSAWQAAKAQAVPEGFVLVEKKILLEGVNKIEQLFEDDQLLALGELLPIQQGLKAMIEAQEQVG